MYSKTVCRVYRDGNLAQLLQSRRAERIRDTTPLVVVVAFARVNQPYYAFFARNSLSCPQANDKKTHLIDHGQVSDKAMIYYTHI